MEYLVPNARVFPFRQPAPLVRLREQWWLTQVQAEEAWRRLGHRGSRRVTVAVIDTGADYRHMALSVNMVPGWDFINNNADPMDITYYGFPGHGTHCSGIIGATGEVENGTSGVSPEVSLMPLRFIDDNGGLISNAIKAIDFAIAKKVDVISASWGARMSRAGAAALLEAIARAERAGVVFVTAAANEGKDNDVTDVFPANAGLSNTITVAATDRDDKRPDWSNYGRTKVHLAAPGKSIMSTLPGNRYATMDGTSMAAPIVAGLVALIKAEDPGLAPLQIRSLLQATGVPAAAETACDCRVSALQAVEAVKSRMLFLSPQAGELAVGGEVQLEGVYGRPPLTFTSDRPDVATVDVNGRLRGLTVGEVIVGGRDADGKSASSRPFRVRQATKL